MLMALPRLWRYMRKYRPDIVHCNLFDDSVPGLIAAKLAGVKVRVITKQDTGYHYLHAPHWMAVDRFNSRMATHVLAISNESKRFLIHKEGTPEHKITLVHNGIPSEQFTRQDPVVMDRLKQRFGTANKGPIIGTVARFIEWKGYKSILVAARSRERTSGCTFSIVRQRSRRT
ncbi:MAG: glycosyltransferase [Flavobacteriales bacterium]|nr:glycosyltransferase [Flavobacteriales bacterium]